MGVELAQFPVTVLITALCLFLATSEGGNRLGTRARVGDKGLLVCCPGGLLKYDLGRDVPLRLEK